MSEIVQGKPQNEATEKELRTRSTFGLTYDFFQTMRFGEYTPHFVMEGVNNDNLPLHSAHTIRSYTLGAPLMSDIKINKDYFFVPMQAILPLNWNKWYENPVIGQDVPNDCGPSVENFWNKIGTLFTNSWTYLRSYNTVTGATVTNYIDYCFKFLVFFERFYSDGSLMSNLGIHGGQFFGTSIDNEKGTYDDWFNKFISDVFDDADIKAIKIQYGSNTSRYYWINLDSTNSATDRVIGLRDYLEYLRDDFSWTVVAFNSGTLVDSDVSAFSTAVGNFYTFNTGVANTVSGVHCDLRRMWAYQLVCNHYFTNDKVDYIYSAELFRQYINELVTKAYGTTANYSKTFTVNGLEYMYDALSAKYFNEVIGGFDTGGIFTYKSGSAYIDLDSTYAYFRALLGFNNSLRYKDYFTGGRTRPLAVGDTTVDAWTPVVSGYVGAIDITRNIQKQRFLNAINRIPHQIEDYLEGLFGKRPAPDYHNPFFLARTTDQVFGQESEYTGNASDAEQNNITSVLRGQANRYAFDFKPDRDCVVIGITSFDLPRAYSRTIERQAMHLTRFDGFNPYMQFVGDQPIYRAELSPYNVDMNPFAYTLRHMEYKQRYNQVAGGFKRYLPGWAFLAEDNTRPYLSNIDPEFIRSHNTELDKYFKSLTGWSLGSYFHFIVKNNNSMDASRPMAYAPSIL